ncbi:MAG TPA: histidine kinase dimerization/phospho-acceptor domain-containing protein, partial [Candidatus Paceibacterota bacterium]|nr:histidine kinase dimerization/phospho-acceptor domain-containing protein [Candidatus Paceibacterota bacterium]
MKSLRLRLTVWFGVSFIFLTITFAAFSYWYLDSELHKKNWFKDYPEHPDWRIHGSYTEPEIRDILRELVETAMLYTAPLALSALLVGYILARKSVRPITSVNHQLQSIRPPNLSQRIELPEIDVEFRDLVHNTNDLLDRLDHAFHDMSEYAAKVAHELRTPLAILRLKVEQAGDRIAPELAEELQAELHQLTHVVDQSLLIAKAEQRRLVLHPCAFDLEQLVADVAEDFALIAQEEARLVRLF